MKMLTMMLLMTLCLSVSRCTTVNQEIVCKQIEAHQIPNIVSCDVSFQFNRCRCRCFDFNSWTRLPLNKCEEFAGLEGYTKDYVVTKCEGLTGFFLEDAATKVRPNIKALSAIKSNLCN